MIDLVFMPNPLKPSERRFEKLPSMTFEHWVGVNFPGGMVKGTLTVVLNGKKIDSPDSLVFRDGDHVLIIFTPAWATILQYALQALVSLAIGLILSKIFAPKKPTAIVDQPASSPVYSITGSQNAARLGEPIPVGFGSFIQVPDFGSQPYVEFVDHDQYLNEILVIGQGDYRIEDMMVGESSVSGMPAGVIEWQTFTSAQHNQQMGVIEDSTGIYENVVTSPEVGDQELTSGAPYTVPPTKYWRAISNAYILAEAEAPNFTMAGGGNIPPVGYDFLFSHPDEALGTTYSYSISQNPAGGDTGDFVYTWVDVQMVAYAPPPYPAFSIVPAGTVVVPAPGETAVGWFEACKPGQRGHRLMLDFVFPAGLYTSNAGTGELEGKSVVIDIQFQRISDVGSPISPIETFTKTFTDGTSNPRRYTVAIDEDILDINRYRVRVIRVTPNAENNLTVDKIIWTGLKFKLARSPTTQIVYGSTMLVAVKIKATNGVASSATSRIRFRVTRKLPPLGVGAAVTSKNPADAFVDIMTSDYGAGRPLSEVDIDALTMCRNAWLTHNGFNAVFAQRSTIYEALSTSLQPVAAGPLPVGQVMSVQVDSVKDTRVAMFNEANLTNLQIGYEFDKVGSPQGVRVEYRRPDSFDADFVVLPENTTDVDQVSLFGCTDRTTASQYARLVLNRRAKLRKSISFDTELEGLSLLPGDRIGIQHQMPRWGQAAIVTDVSGLTLTLDRFLDWTILGPFGVMISDEENGVSQPIEVSQGSAANIVVLSGAPTFDMFGKGQHQEQTRISFGTLGSILRDWIVINVYPKPENVTGIDAIIYDPAAYIGAMPHQLFDPASGGGAGPTFDFVVAGTPGSPATDYVLAGTPTLPSDDVIVGGVPNDFGV